MGHGDGMEIAREMQINFVHRHHLCITASRGTTLHSEAWSERRFAQSQGRFHPQAVQSHRQPHAHGSFTDARFRGTHGRHQNQMVLFHAVFIHQRGGNFGNVAPVTLEFLRGNATAPRNVVDVFQPTFARNFKVCLHLLLLRIG